MLEDTGVARKRRRDRAETRGIAYADVARCGSDGMTTRFAIMCTFDLSGLRVWSCRFCFIACDACLGRVAHELCNDDSDEGMCDDGEDVDEDEEDAN